MHAPLNSNAQMSFEPTLGVTFLPRCSQCHQPHPMARKPPVERDDCPDCGAKLDQGFSEDVPAVIVGGGPQVWLGLTLIKIGNRLRAWAKEI